MALSKEQQVAKCMNSLISGNVNEIASGPQWNEFICDYFCTSDTQCESDNYSSSDSSDGFSETVGTGEINVEEEDDDDDDNDDNNAVVSDQIGMIMEEVTLVPEDSDEEIKKIQNFSCVSKSSKGSCKLNNGNSCCSGLELEFVKNIRMSMSALPPYEKDLILLGKISSTMCNTKLTDISKRKTQTERKHQRTQYLVEGHHVCREMFKFLHCISQDKLTALLSHYKEFGLVPRYKKSGGRRSTDARLLKHDDISRVVSFILNFAEDHAIALPGRIPGYKKFDFKLLPSSSTKASVWNKYKVAMETTGNRAVKLHSFRKLWRTLVPFIVQSRPATDLCWMCKKNNSSIYKSANMPNEEKSERLKQQETHLHQFTLERSLYQDMVQKAKSVVSDIKVKLGTNAPASKEMTMHYSFDYAQQVHFPSDPMQPGPMYFLTPRKCGLFGVACEGIPQQVNYLIDECMCITKGSNAVISYLDHFFDKFGLGETAVELHCDNCSGQNKNNYMLWYLAWRVLNGLHKSVSLNFLIAGHTKFAPDWCFGLVKQNYRRNMVSCLDDIVTVVNTSTVTGVNIAQLVGRENGEIMVPQYDWQTFLKPHFRVFTGLKKFHHFRFDSTQPGVVFAKEYADSVEIMETLLSGVPPRAKPLSVTPPGLDQKRQQYLYQKIREFCTPSTMNITCPVPSVVTNNDPIIPLAEVVVNAAPTGMGRGRTAKRGRKRQHVD